MVNCVVRRDYPILDSILWDTKAELLSDEFAFRSYEKRWFYVDQGELSDYEKNLIKRLTESVGKGLFLPAC